MLIQPHRGHPVFRIYRLWNGAVPVSGYLEPDPGLLRITIILGMIE